MSFYQFISHYQNYTGVNGFFKFREDGVLRWQTHVILKKNG